MKGTLLAQKVLRARGKRDMRIPPSTLLIPGLLAGVTLMSAIFAWRLAAPFAILAPIGLGWAMLGCRRARSYTGRIAAFSLCILFLGAAETETYFYIVTRSEFPHYQISAAWQRRDRQSGLGDITIPGAVAEQKAFHGSKLLYDVVYSIDANGLRHIPAEVEGGPLKVAFVGCSYMFGHGLNDNQTLPYFFLKDAHGIFQGFNFAVDDWGPHEILREIELGKVAEVVKRPNLVIYEALSDHLVRTSGRNVFDPFGPKYVLCEKNIVCYRGPFHSAIYEALLQWFCRSWTFWYLEIHEMRHVRHTDIPLYLSILARIQTSVEENGGQFIVLFWDSWPQDDEIVNALRSKRFEVIQVSTFIHDLRSNQTNYLLSRFDPHPTARANQIMADYLFRRVGKVIAIPAQSARRKVDDHPN